MTKTELDVLWSRALHEALVAGEEFTRYRFAAMVASAEREVEREACAQLCDEVDKESQSQWPKRLATMIRARGNT
jgi:hypothetical protein